MFGDIGGGAAIFAAQRQALDQPQAGSASSARRSRAGVAGQQADDEGRQAHQAHRDQEGIFAPDQVAEPAEYQRAERPHRKAGGEGGEREDEARGLVDAGEEVLRDDRGEQAVEVEIIPFEDGAEREAPITRTSSRRRRSPLRSFPRHLPPLTAIDAHVSSSSNSLALRG